MINPETINALRQRKTGTLRQLANALQLPENDMGLLSDILRSVHRNVSRDAENRVRAALGLRVDTEYLVPACAACGNVHHCSCEGRPVKRVVTLAPGETIRRAPRPANRISGYSVSQLRRAITERREYQP